MAFTEMRLFCLFLHPPGDAFAQSAKTRQLGILVQKKEKKESARILANWVAVFSVVGEP